MPLLINYESRDSKIFKVSGAVIFCISDKQICLYYVFLKKYTKLFSFDKFFENLSYNEISGILIHDLLMNIVLFRGFEKDNTPTVILTCPRVLLSYYLFKSFVILPKKSEAMNNVTREVKHHINAIDMHKNDSVMTCTKVIVSVVNTFKHIYSSKNLFTEFESKLF